jgi:hypothetical protein
MNNDFKNDTRLLFASATLQQLHARIEPAERLDYLLKFAPPRQSGGSPGDELEHPQAHMGWRQYSINCLAGGCLFEISNSKGGLAPFEFESGGRSQGCAAAGPRP